MKGNHRTVRDDTTNEVDHNGSGTGKKQKVGERHDDTHHKSTNEVGDAVVLQHNKMGR